MNRIRWTRKELKNSSKRVLHTYYGKMVLAMLLLSFFFGGGQVASGIIEPLSKQFTQGVAKPSDGIIISYGNLDEATECNHHMYYIEEKALAVTKAITVVVMSLMLFLITVMAKIFILNPIRVGSVRFLCSSFEKQPKLKDIFYVFENQYRNVATVMFLRDLYTLLWSMLLVIPGIIKLYEYRMVPYLLAENTSMDARTAFEVSRKMMAGQKWKTFVLDLSFFGWNLLSGITFGIAGVLFVDPYERLTDAGLYRRLRGLDGTPENIYYEGMPLESENIEQKWEWNNRGE